MTRSISDAVQILQDAWNAALVQWKQQYPQQSQPFIDCVYRSDAEQQATYNQGRTTPGKIVTHALPGQSAHNYLPSYAFDIAFVKEDGTLDWDVSLFKMFSAVILAIEPRVEWGGNWSASVRDNPHFEIQNWPTLIPKS